MFILRYIKAGPIHFLLLYCMDLFCVDTVEPLFSQNSGSIMISYGEISADDKN